MTAIDIVSGHAVLEVHPPGWPHPSLGDQVDHAVAVLRALWTAHPYIMSISIGHNMPVITVEVAIPKDGSLDLTALQRDLHNRVREALRRTR
jgi:hypothetical protein